MNQSELKSHLHSLHAEFLEVQDELQSVEEIDNATIDALHQLVVDAKQLAESAEKADAPTGETDQPGHTIMDQLNEFESDHPRIANFVNRLGELLATMGI